MARVERLDQHIERLREKIEQAKNHPAVQKMMGLQEKLDEALRVNEEILAAEEEVQVMAAPRKPREKKEVVPIEKEIGHTVSDSTRIVGTTAERAGNGTIFPGTLPETSETEAGE